MAITMKKLMCILISAIMVTSIFTALPTGAFAVKNKAQKVSLKKSSATLYVYVEKGKKTTYTSRNIKVKKAKGVKIEKITYKSSSKKTAKVSKTGTVTAKSAGKANITVKVTYNYKKKTYTKKLTFKATVKKKNVKTSSTQETKPESTQAVETTAAETAAETASQTAAPETTQATEATEAKTEAPSEAVTAHADTQTSTFEEAAPTAADGDNNGTLNPTSEPAEDTTAPESVTEYATASASTADFDPGTVPEDNKTTEATKAPAVEETTAPETETTPAVNTTFEERLSAFSNKLYAMSAEKEDNNYTMSPISVYMAVSILYYFGDDTVKSDIEKLTSMTAEDFAKTGELFKNLNNEVKDNKDNIISRLSLTNSVWADKSENVNEDELNKVLEAVCAFFRKTTFTTDNEAANKELREFIKKETNGLIDKDFQLSEQTLYALVNTLYLKDIWSSLKEIRTEKTDFTLSDGTTKNCKFLFADYCEGQVMQTDCSYFFHAITENGYKLELILPKGGHTLKEAMSEKNLNSVKATTDYKALDEKNVQHYTRCIFPCFEISSDIGLKKILQENNYLPHCFDDFTSPLTESPLVVSDIKHSAVVKVNEDGIEGAAVTIIAIDKNGISIEQPVYHDFLVDSSFGFIISDKNGVTLFEGQVTNPEKMN